MRGSQKAGGRQRAQDGHQAGENSAFRESWGSPQRLDRSTAVRSERNATTPSTSPGSQLYLPNTQTPSPSSVQPIRSRSKRRPTSTVSRAKPARSPHSGPSQACSPSIRARSAGRRNSSRPRLAATPCASPSGFNLPNDSFEALRRDVGAPNDGISDPTPRTYSARQKGPAAPLLSRNQRTRVATFNVEGLSDHKRDTIDRDFNRYRLSILGLTETHLPGEASELTDSGHEIFRCGTRDRPPGRACRQGVAIMVAKNLRGNVEEYTGYSDRLMTLKLRTSSHPSAPHLTIICVYMLTEPRAREQPELREQLYQQVCSIVEEIPQRDYVYLLGDFNAKIAPKQGSMVGSYAKHRYTSANGEYLVNLLSNTGLTAANTLFPHRMAHRSTWTSRGQPHRDGKPVRNQIDYICVRQRYATSVMTCRSWEGFETESDHRPVIMEIRWRIRALRPELTTEHPCFRKYHQFSSAQAAQFAATVRDALPPLPRQAEGSPADPTQMLETLTKTLHDIAEDTVGIAEKKAQQHRSTSQEVAQLSERQKKLRIQIDSCTEPNRRKHLVSQRKKAKKALDKQLAKERDQQIQEMVDRVDKQVGNGRQYSASVKELQKFRGGRQNRAILHLRDENTGKMHTGAKENCKRFTDYFRPLFHDESQPIAFSGNGVQDSPFTQEEVAKSLGKMPKGKAAGVDGLTVEMLKAGGAIVVRFLTFVFNLLIETDKEIPQDLNLGLMVPMLKAMKAMGVAGNHRPVMLLSVIRKLLTSTLAERQKSAVYSRVRERQAGFRSGRSTADGVFFMRMMCERACIGDWKYAAALLDFSRAFDTIPRAKLLSRLQNMNAPTRLLAKLMSDTRVRVKFAGHLGDEFQSNTGVFQGDCISPLNYIAFAEETMRKIDQNWDEAEREAEVQQAGGPKPRRSARIAALQARSEHRCTSTSLASNAVTHEAAANEIGPPGHSNCEILRSVRVAKQKADVPARDTAYADDTALHQNTIEQIHDMIDQAKPVFEEDGLNMNETKNQIVEVKAVPVCEQRNWRSIKHLGSLLGTSEDVQRRITLAEVAFSSIPWRRHKMSVGIKMFRSLIMSVLMYNAGLWTLTQSLEEKLDKWQRRKVRFIGRFSGENRIRNNRLYAIFRLKPISHMCRKLRLTWLGHVIREGRGAASFEALQKALDIKDIRWKRKGWKNQTRWVDVVNDDLSNIGLNIDGAMKIASNKRAWAKTVDRCLASWETDLRT